MYRAKAKKKKNCYIGVNPTDPKIRPDPTFKNTNKTEQKKKETKKKKKKTTDRS